MRPKLVLLLSICARVLRAEPLECAVQLEHVHSEAQSNDEDEHKHGSYQHCALHLRLFLLFGCLEDALFVARDLKILSIL